MFKQKEYVTTFQSIVTIILKEFRMQQGKTQAEFAEFCGKQVSLWNKIENGSSSLSLENILKICFRTQIQVSYLFQLAECYRQFLQHDNWYVSTNEKNDADCLFEMSQAWFENPQRVCNAIQEEEIITAFGFKVSLSYSNDILFLPISQSVFQLPGIQYAGEFIVHPLFKSIISRNRLALLKGLS